MGQAPWPARDALVPLLLWMRVLWRKKRPTRGSAADVGVRPPICADVRKWENYVALQSCLPRKRTLAQSPKCRLRAGCRRIACPPQVQNPSRGIVCRIGCHPAPPMVPRPPALGAPRLYCRFPPNPSRKLNLCRTGRLLQEAIRAKAKTGKHFRDFDRHNRVRTSFGTREIIWCSNKICLYRSAAECILRSITLRLWEQ